MTTLRVGLIGLGTIGTGVAQLLLTHRDLLSQRLGKTVQLVRICDLDIARDRGVDLSTVDLTTEAARITEADDIDLVIELMGGLEPARSFVKAALAHGKHVVSANKALIAKHGEELFPLAAEKGLQIGFEAAVGGGIPCMKALREGLAANAIESIYGILNGTCNYILSKMETEGADFAEVLAQAQELGYAEADPTFDVEGIDTAHKLSILAAMAFGSKIKFDDIYTEGISRITPADIASAHELGYRIKLLGIAKPHGSHDAQRIEMRVHPTLVPLDSQLAQVSDSYNAVQITGDFVGQTMFFGRGAGERPTASAVVADIVDVASGFPEGVRHLAPPMGFVQEARRDVPTLPMADTVCEYYLRLMVKDQPGVIAAVTSILADHRISLEAVLQKERHATREVPVIMLTHGTTEGNMQAALARILALDTVDDRHVLLLRKEEFGA